MTTASSRLLNNSWIESSSVVLLRRKSSECDGKGSEATAPALGRRGFTLLRWAGRLRGVRHPLRPEGCRRMVRIAVQATSGAVRFGVAVQAESVERALRIAKKQDLGRNSEVTLPINSEVFFAAEPVAVSGSARPGRSAAKPGGRVFKGP